MIKLAVGPSQIELTNLCIVSCLKAIPCEVFKRPHKSLSVDF